jgi:pSer/pThr/pTyr-binding forkhead associated (FHA) protein
MNGKLIVSEGGRERVHELLDETTVIGRATQADLRVKDPKTAPLHCEVRRTPQGFKLVDLETRDGTRVNGRHVNAHLLNHGDVVEIGDLEITYFGESPAGGGPKAPQVLLEVPRDESGEPRKFYRHESETKKTGLETAAKCVVAAVAVIMALLLAKSMYNAANDVNKAKLAQAKELLRKVETEEKARRIMKILSEIEPGSVDPREIVELRREAQDRVEGFESSRLASEEAAAWAALVHLHKTRPDLAKDVLKAADEFTLKFPATEKLEELRKIRRTAELGGDPEAEWSALLKYVETATGFGKFAEAYAAFAKFEGREALRRELGSRVDLARRALDDQYAAYVAQRFKAAQVAAAAGDADGARRIYGEIVEIGVLPHSETAKKALEALK